MIFLSDKKKEKIDKKDEQIKDLTETLQRLQADFENYKKRIEKENQDFIKLSKKELIIKLLPILDSFSLAFANKCNGEEFIKGMELIFSQFVQTLEDEGLKAIVAKGEKFDPYKHEALLAEEGDEDNIVLEELQKGYTLNDTIIRHTKVKISKKGVKDDKKGDSAQDCA